MLVMHLISKNILEIYRRSLTMKKMLVVVLALVLTGGVVYADDSALVAWDAPTHRTGPDNDCLTQGNALTQAEIDSLEYTLSYRVKGTTDWTSVDTVIPSATVDLPGYEVTYEMITGARFPGGSIVCVTNVVEHTTAPDTAPPGACTDPVVTVNP